MCERCATATGKTVVLVRGGSLCPVCLFLSLELWDDRRLGRMRHQRVANLGPMTKTG